MRLLAVIVLIFLIAKSSFGLNIVQLADSQCCNTDPVVIEQGIDISSDSDSHEKNCCGLNCDCMCCSHILVKEKEIIAVVVKRIENYQETIQYEDNYILQYQNLVWHPPRDVQ